MIDNKTPHLSLPLPHADNLLTDDVPRLRAALDLLDTHAAQADANTGQTAADLADVRTVAESAAKTALWPDIAGKPEAFPAAGHDHGTISGNAATATKLQTARTVALSGDVTAPGVDFDGSDNVTLTVNLTERAQTLGSISGAVALNLSAGLYIAATITGATTLRVAAAPAGDCATVLLELTNGGSAAVTWGMSPRWSNGVAPVLTASGVDLVALTHRKGAWIGALVASNVR